MAITNGLTRTTTAAPAKSMSEYLASDKVKGMIERSFNDKKEAQKFVSNILAATSTNTELKACTHESIVSSAMLATSLNLSLSPSIGLAYLVPFKNNKDGNARATFILGYRGYIQLAIRSGVYKKINVMEIKEGELISADPINEEYDIVLTEDEEERQLLPTIGYYAYFEHMNGFRKAIYWTKKKMLLHADKYSPAFSFRATKNKMSFADYEAGKVPEKEMYKYSSYWYSDFDGMAKKTMIRQLISKWGIMSVDMQTAYEKDSESMKANEAYYDESATAKEQKQNEEKSVEDDFFNNPSDSFDEVNQASFINEDGEVIENDD